MDKGLLLILAIGIAIVYFATSFSGDKPIDEDISWSVSEKKHTYDRYYEKDALGDRVLNLSSVSRDQAKKIWPTTPTGKKIASLLPDFALARTEVSNNVVKGAFQVYLLEYLDNLEERFLAGEINGDRAQRALLGLQ
jgi:hypothetical protein